MIDIQEKYSNKNLDPRWDNQKISYDIKKYWHHFCKYL